ncbi:hypothetical protein BDAP_002183 [Binucleata daphniae]
MIPLSQKTFQIAIDGPSGVGKSSTAEALSAKLNFVRIDSGMLYRALTYILLQKHNEITENLLNSLKDEIMKIKFEVYTDRIIYDEINIKPFLRQKDVEMNVSLVAKQSYVRKRIREIQNILIKDLKNIIIDVRDIGTIILPNADLKIYLTASDEIRARRRWLENGKTEKYEKVLDDMRKRDYDDINREHGPLKKAEDAIEIDNSNITFEEGVDKIYNLVQSKREQ